MRGRWLFSLTALLLGFFVFAPGNSPQAQREPKRLLLLHSNNINGEIDPCPT